MTCFSYNRLIEGKLYYDFLDDYLFALRKVLLKLRTLAKENFLCAQNCELYGSFGLQLERNAEGVELRHLCSTSQRGSAKVGHVRYGNITLLRMVSFFS